MSKIKIQVLGPFGLRLNSDTPKREFAKGEHVVSREELQHWYMQAQLKEKNVLVLGDEVEADGGAVQTAPASAKPKKTATNA